jgi:hypothetical protein
MIQLGAHVARPRADAEPPARCAHCGEVIGVYEPMFIVPREGIPMLTSLTATPDAERRGRLLHDYCGS